MIVFLLRNHLSGMDIPKPVAFGIEGDGVAEPMRRALSGESGTIIGLDYRGVKVLAAYEPVRNLGMGIVAKVDMQEIYAPYIRAFGLTIITAIILVFISMFIFLRLSQQISEKFEDSTKQFQRIANNAKDMIYRMSLPDGVYEFVSPASYEIFGYTPDEFYKKPLMIHDMIHPDWHSYLEEQWKKLLAGDMPPNYEYQIITREGESRWINQRNVLITDANEKPIAIEGIVTDTTEQKRGIEGALREQRYLDIAGVLFVSLNNLGEITMINKRGCEILGYSHDEIMHQNWFETCVPPDIQDDVKSVFNQLMSGELEAVEYYENALLNKKGEMLEISFHNTLLTDSTGKVIGVLFSGEDITDRKQAQLELGWALEETIDAVAKAVEARDPYTAGHQRRVAELAVAVSEEMGLEDEVIKGIRLGATIHDIGKIQLPAEILSKPAKLTDVEYALIQGHSEAGYEILKEIKCSWPVAKIAHQHHERVDGSGYPLGLKADDICLEAKIVAVADVVEAMSSHRPYRASRGIDVALEEIRIQRGKLFDPEVVDACLTIFEENRFTW